MKQNNVALGIIMDDPIEPVIPDISKNDAQRVIDFYHDLISFAKNAHNHGINESIYAMNVLKMSYTDVAILLQNMNAETYAKIIELAPFPSLTHEQKMQLL